MKICLATLVDFNTMMDIYYNAREFMKNHNNPNQWGDFWPTEEAVKDFINNKYAYVITNNEEIVACFVFKKGDDDYSSGIQGKWLSKSNYGYIHVVASKQIVKGIFPFIVQYLEKLKINLRIDTHVDNKIMLHQIEKCGFKYCGRLIADIGGERVGFEKLANIR